MNTHLKTTYGYLSKTSVDDWLNVHQQYLNSFTGNTIAKKLGITKRTLIKYFKLFNLELLSKETENERMQILKKKYCLEKYGVEYISQAKEIKDKKKETCMEKYGVEYSLQSKKVRGKIEGTCIEKYGANSPLKNKLIKDKIKNTNLEKYGVENPNQCEEIKEKKKKTCIKKYGVENPNQCKEIRDKSVKTNLRRYGVENPNQCEEIKEKKKKTCIKKYGVDHNFKVKECLDKRITTYLKNYGVKNPSQCKEIKEKKKQTCISKYGVPHVLQVKSIRKEIRSTVEHKTLLKIENNLKKKGYEFIDDYNGGHESDVRGNHVAWRRYNIKHLECGAEYETYFNGDIFVKCPKCYPYQSNGELELRSYIQILLPEINLMTNTKDIIFKELDIYIKELNIAFEYNGSYWHSVIHDKINKNYHKTKTEMCLNKSIKLYHIWEHDNEDIVKSLIKIKLNKIENKHFARKLQIKEVKVKERREFFNNNHLHGDVNSTFALGLYNGNDLLQCISFRKHKEGIEIARFATLLNTNVTGGFSKLLKHSITKIKELGYSKIITYCDRDWTPSFKDSVYYKNGFTFVGDSGVQLNYFNNKLNIVESREKYQKHKLQKLFPDVYDENLVADEILSKKGIYPIYNSGNWKFELVI